MISTHQIQEGDYVWVIGLGDGVVERQAPNKKDFDGPPVFRIKFPQQEECRRYWSVGASKLQPLMAARHLVLRYSPRDRQTIRADIEMGNYK